MCKMYSTLQLGSTVSPGASGRKHQEKPEADHKGFGAGGVEDQKPTIAQLKESYQQHMREVRGASEGFFCWVLETSY